MAESTKRIPTYPRCPICGKQFLYREELTEHLRQEHGYAASVTDAPAVSSTEYADLKKENAALRNELQELATLVKGVTAAKNDPVDTSLGTQAGS